MGDLFEIIKDDMCGKNIAQRLWALFEVLLQIVIDCISKNGETETQKQSFWGCETQVIIQKTSINHKEVHASLE